ncbi:catalase family protein [Paludisphaera sp.]|uniref:catalase family protein n=1 Tax=Paludisphaera sp. TaxID=2017432 RepID=UPI00301CD459
MKSRSMLLGLTAAAAFFGPPSFADSPPADDARPDRSREFATPPPDEAQAKATLLRDILTEMRHSQDDGGDGAVARNQHAKHHGAVRATFAVADGLPEGLRVGIFREPRSYDAVLRFSNGRARVDNVPDAHGLAIKILGVEGKPLLDDPADAGTQDFVLIDHPVFFATDPTNLVRVEAARKALERGEQVDITPIREQIAIARAFPKLGTPSPLEMTYFSTVPSRLGARAVKYRASPSPDNASGLPPLTKASSVDALREAMVARLSTNREPARFDFQLLLQQDEQAMPIEDPTVEWTTTPITVATITINPQAFTGAEQLEFAENLSYTPWHGIEEHRPIGGINRVRKDIYQAGSAFRHDANGAPRKEPTVADLDRLYQCEAAEGR